MARPKVDHVTEVWPELVAAAAQHGATWQTTPGKRQRQVVADRMRDGATPAQLVAAIHGAMRRYGKPRDDFDPLAYLTATTIYRPANFDANAEQGAAARDGPASKREARPDRFRLIPRTNEAS